MLSGKNEEPKTTWDYRVRTAPLLVVTLACKCPDTTQPALKAERTETQSTGEKAVMPEGGQHQLS